MPLPAPTAAATATAATIAAPAGTAPLDWALALLALAVLLALGTGLGRVLGSRSWGVPEALIAGALGLLLAPAGALPLLPQAVIAVWEQLPLILLTLVFGTLLLGKPLPQAAQLWRPLSAQLLLALTLAFGQYLVAALVVLALSSRLGGLHPLLACLIEVAYEGGHGSAAAMGPTYARLGFPGGEALGLAMATVGLLSSTLVGGVVVVLARRFGWLAAAAPAPAGGEAATAGAAAAPGAGVAPGAVGGAAGAGGEAEATGGATGAAGRPATAGDGAAASDAVSPSAAVQAGAALLPARPAGPRAGAPTAVVARADGGAAAAWARNLALTGLAVALGWLALAGLQLLGRTVGGGFGSLTAAFPVFPLAIIGSLLVRLALERSGRSAWASAPIQGLVATLSADLLITAATACLDLSLLAHDWLPLTALAVAGLVWNLAVVLLLGPRILPSPWFERGILEFGQATGVAASGLLLLHMADPEDRADALPAFSIKQLLLQPLIAGGVITVVAPLAITSLGLPLWSGLCLLLVLLWIGLALLLARRPAGASAAG
jgi:ESS family glutamate:Na+ symporter